MLHQEILHQTSHLTKLPLYENNNIFDNIPIEDNIHDNDVHSKSKHPHDEASDNGITSIDKIIQILETQDSFLMAKIKNLNLQPELPAYLLSILKTWKWNNAEI